VKQQVGLVRRWAVGVLGAAALALCTVARADINFAIEEGLDAAVGGDMRIRLEGFDRSVLSPENAVYGRAIDFGPAYQYLRVRTRLWGSLKFEDWMKLNARLTNRTQYYKSHPNERNNSGPMTWEFPDEVVLDALNIQLMNVLDTNWSLTLGRQDFPLGNGMVFLEGTPYDQGRTIYFDGLSAVWKEDKDTLKLFAFYDNYKDKFAFWDDQNRALRRGDIFTTGAYWTHNFRKDLNTDLYYIYANVNDPRPEMNDPIERNFRWSGPPPQCDNDTLVHTAGARVFGALHEQVDYSVEYAEQYGDYNHDIDVSGDLLDARLTLKAPKDTLFSPSVLFQYTSWSGDDPDSAGEYEGWDPLFASYPIFREELLPILFNGNWCNMDQYRVEGRAAVNQCWSVAAAYAYLAADYGDSVDASGGGNGDSLGHLVSVFVDYKPAFKIAKRVGMSFALELAEFFPSSYWNDGDNSTWGRLQTIFSF
jgi:hypothetical protein